MNTEWTIREARTKDGSLLCLAAFLNDEEAGVRIRDSARVVSQRSVPRNGHAWREVMNQAVEEASFDKFVATYQPTRTSISQQEDAMKRVAYIESKREYHEDFSNGLTLGIYRYYDSENNTWMNGATCFAIILLDTETEILQSPTDILTISSYEQGEVAFKESDYYSLLMEKFDMFKDHYSKVNKAVISQQEDGGTMKDNRKQSILEMLTDLRRARFSATQSADYYKSLPLATLAGSEAKTLVSEAVEDFKTLQGELTRVAREAERYSRRLDVTREGDGVPSSVKSIARQAVTLLGELDKATTFWKDKIVKQSSTEGTETKPTKPSDHIQETVKEAEGLRKLFSIFGHDVVLRPKRPLGSYSPPTDVKDTGDKWPAKGDSAKVELNQWHAGEEEFHATKRREDRYPNSAIDPRLTDAGSPHDPQPYINATLIRDRNALNSKWIVSDRRNNRKVVFSFKDVCASEDDVTKSNYETFTSDVYKRQIQREASRFGLLFVKKATNGRIIHRGIDEEKGGEEETPPEGKDAQPKEKEEAKTVEIEVKPLDKAVTQIEKAVDKIDKLVGGEPEKKPKELPEAGPEELPVEGGEGGPPTGGPPELPPEITAAASRVYAQNGEEGLKAYYTKMFGDADYAAALVKDYRKKSQAASVAAEQAVRLARLQASRGVIPFTKPAIRDAATRLVSLSGQAYQQVWKTIESLPLMNPIALTAGEIPEANNMQSGVVGDRLQGVRNPKGTVKTRGDIANDVAADAKIAGRRSFVPQLQVEGASSVTLPFTTTESKLEAKGVDARQFLRAHYKQ